MLFTLLKTNQQREIVDGGRCRKWLSTVKQHLLLWWYDCIGDKSFCFEIHGNPCTLCVKCITMNSCIQWIIMQKCLQNFFVPSKASVVFLMKKLKYVHFVTIMPILHTWIHCKYCHNWILLLYSYFKFIVLLKSSTKFCRET